MATKGGHIYFMFLRHYSAAGSATANSLDVFRLQINQWKWTVELNLDEKANIQEKGRAIDDGAGQNKSTVEMESRTWILRFAFDTSTGWSVL